MAGEELLNAASVEMKESSDEQKYESSATQIVSSNAETCIVCGQIIPEGRIICPICECRLLNK